MERLIEVEGSSFQRGRMIGERFKELIKMNVEYYSSIWRKILGDETEDFAESSIPLIKDYDEEIFSEISGVAEGSGLTLEEIVLLNSRYEALNFVAPEGCTSFAVLPNACRNGRVLVGQNWDLSREVVGRDIVIIVKREGKPPYITNTEAGVLAHKGMNSEGIGICFNALKSNVDKLKPCVPMLLILRKLYDSKNLSDLISFIQEAERSTSANFLVAHKDGEAISLEVTPREIEIITPEEGLLFHTNHFLSPFLLNRLVDLNRENPDTHIRLMRIKSLLSRRKREIGIEFLMDTLRDHFNWPESICRHGVSVTIASLIMDLKEARFLLCRGNPCEGKYESLKWWTN